MSFFDEYVINTSDLVESVGRQETRVDFELDKNAGAQTGSVTGTVKDDLGNPIAEAVVKLNTCNILPYYHTNTNSQGIFTINNVPAGSYLIAAILRKVIYFASHNQSQLLTK